MAWLGRTPVTSRGLMQPSVSPWAAERTMARRDRLTSAPMPASGLETCSLLGCPHAQLLSPLWHE